MESTSYISLCVQLYDLSNQQRDSFSELLASRALLYEECEGLLSFEHLYELSDNNLKRLLADADIEQLAYAQLGTSKTLQAKILGGLAEMHKTEIEAAIERITPARLSVVEQARDAILGKMQDLVASGTISAVSIADPRINQICTALPETLPDRAKTLSRALLAMGNESVRSLLKEIRVADLAGALLYMQDARVIRKAMLNLSQDRASRLLDDLVEQHRLHSMASRSDQSSCGQRWSSETAFAHFKKILLELMNSGQIDGDVETIGDPDDLYWNQQYIGKLREAAKLGDAEAQYLLGKAYIFFEELAGDYVEAIKWWRKAADQQHAASQYELGTCYEQGNGAHRDDAAAAIWYRKAAELGDARAQTRQGVQQLGGAGVPQDYVAAASWFGKAAEQSEPVAQYQLGLLYRRGTGVPRDDAEAAAWFRKSANEGNAEAQYNLGLLYAKGNGVPKDETEAAVWFLEAAKQEQVDAQLAIGLMYESGRGVPQDINKAIRWIRRAADAGESMAIDKLQRLGVDP